MSHSNVGIRGYSHGIMAKVFGFQSSVVLLMDYDENQTIRLLSLGEFVVYLLLQIHRPFVVAGCYVDGFHWPLTKDSIIFRVTKRTFVFALPGLLYGLQFPNFCTDQIIDSLENVFTKYGHYCKVLDDKRISYSLNDEEPLLWYKLRPRIESMANEVLGRFGHFPGMSRFCVSKNINSSYDRAIRMSAATILLVEHMSDTETLNESHVIVAGTNPALIPDGLVHQSSTFASVSVFTCLVDFLEFVEINSNGLGYMIQGCEPPLRTEVFNIGYKHWKLNENGFRLFTNLLGLVVEQEQEVMAEKVEKLRVKVKEVYESFDASTFASTSPSGDSTSTMASGDKGKCVMP